MEPFLRLKGVDRHYEYAPSKEYLDELVDKYELHEIVEEDIASQVAQDKIDVYDNCLFVVLHFPKYQQNLQKYVVNEFSVILGKEYIVTLTRYKTNHIETIKTDYEKEIATMTEDEKYKYSPYYILYMIIDEMYDKILRALRNFTADLRSIEDDVFSTHKLQKSILEQIMLKRRNIVALKHMIMPQREILKQLQQETLKFFGGELDVYFEDLESQLDKVMRNVDIVTEDIDSLYDTYNATVNMKINSIITVLTILTAVTWMLTLITGFWGMNIPLPLGDHYQAYIYLSLAMFFIAWCMVLIFKRLGWI